MKPPKHKRGDAVIEDHVEQYVQNFKDALKSKKIEQYFYTPDGVRTGEFMGRETFEGLLSLTDADGHKPDGLLTYFGLAYEDEEFNISPVPFPDGRKCELRPRVFVVPINADGKALTFEALGRRVVKQRESLYGLKDDVVNGGAGHGGPHPPYP